MRTQTNLDYSITNTMIRTPERLIVECLRCIAASNLHNDEMQWQNAWQMCARELGPAAGGELVDAADHWFRMVRKSAKRDLAVNLSGCGRIYRDESIALAMLASLQAGDEATAHACALHLIGLGTARSLEPIITASQTLAGILAAQELYLLRSSLLAITEIAAQEPKPYLLH